MATSGENTDPVMEALTYYQSVAELDAQIKFENLDDAMTLDRAMQTVQSNKTLNFVVDFSEGTAWVSSDLLQPQIEQLMCVDRPEALNTRWINIWFPQHSKTALELLAKRYDFSPRLLALMGSDPAAPRRSPNTLPQDSVRRRQHWSLRSQTRSNVDEAEKGLDELSDHSSISSYDSALRGNLYKIIDDLWHYSSIDFGRNYVCIGYNSLYGTKHAGAEDEDGLLPHCTRVWTWLVLCEDNTVLSIHEDPFPFAADKLNPLQQRILAETRRNLVNVFRSLSTVEKAPLRSKNPLALLPLRARLGYTPEETVHRESDTPGLLFYYLFENWHNSYTLITRRESRYGIELNRLRTEMFKTPQLHHIDRLDSIGKELGVLKKHYESYNRLIDRLLEPQHATSASLQNSRIVSEASQTSLDTVRPIVTERESMLGVPLSSSARAHFKRLRDLIDLYALSEVEEYMKQKESLVAMNFNLIAIKESLDVERLTRITLLLTKVTIIFLPVSLMTAYFSVGLVGVAYTVKDFWVSFAITLLLSWVALFVFGVFSGSVQTITFFRGLRDGVVGVGKWVRTLFEER